MGFYGIKWNDAGGIKLNQGVQLTAIDHHPSIFVLSGYIADADKPGIKALYVIGGELVSDDFDVVFNL